MEENDVEMQPVGVSKLNVSGVSNLSTKEIEEILFGKLREAVILGTGESLAMNLKVEWLHDDACNVVCGSETQTELLLSLGEPIEGATDGSVALSELVIRRATELDTKRESQSWKDSQYYKKRLSEKGINPETLRPVGKVILKPARAASPKKVSLIPRRLLQQAKQAIYGDEAFSKRNQKKQMNEEGIELDKDELARRAARCQRFHT